MEIMGVRGANGAGGPSGFAARLLDALLPVQCVGCGIWDTVLCPACARLADGTEPDWHVLETSPPGPDLGVWTLGEYEGRLRRIVLAAKHGERVGLAGFLERAGRALGEGVAASGLVGGARGEAEDIWVVPAPSGWRRRFRGQMVAPDVARGVGSALARSTGLRVRVISCVRLRAGAPSQSGRSAEERRSGRAGSMASAADVPPGVAVVLVDDVITTGATLRELARVCGTGTVAAAALCRAGPRAG
jgi:predicted amidophosphoribosyltransferase